jgi:hypothetical protein
MRKSWWWLSGWRKKWRLEKRREQAFAAIREQRSPIQAMAQRPRAPEDPLDRTLLDETSQRLSELENAVGQATNRDDLDDCIALIEKTKENRKLWSRRACSSLFGRGP